MPLVSANAPTDAYKVQGVSLQLPRAYFDGAVLTADEASWMNRQLGNVVTNSYSSGIRRQLSEIDKSRAASWKAKKYTGPMDEAGKKPAAATILDLCDSKGRPIDHQAAILAKFEAYHIGADNRGRGKGAKTTLDVVARNIAAAWVKDYLRAHGQSIKKFTTAKNVEYGTEFGRLVANYLAKRHDYVYHQAEAQIAASRTASEGVELDMGDIGLTEPAQKTA